MKKVIFILFLPLIGCSSIDTEPNMDNLLHQEQFKNIAYKSINIKDILGEKDYN